MRRAFYLTHPQVRIDPAVPVPQWGLSDVGLTRAGIAAAAPWTAGLAAIVSSEECKAVEAADIIGTARGIAPVARADMHENDRSATGYLPGPEFEQVADAFFANPTESVRGWERAADAQARLLAAVREELARMGGPVLFVGHGAVGTLLMCHLLGEPISRSLDQPQGGGNVFCWDAATGRVLHRWLKLEDQRVGMLG
jgi:broad specificity phosphatase PhoE